MVRLANKFDIPKIKTMLYNYQNSGSYDFDVTNEETGMKLLTYILVGGGVAFISEKQDNITGMLLAIKTPFMWDNSQFVMTEIAYWVEPEYRHGTHGYRLLKEYVKHCEELKETNQIKYYTMTQMHGQNLNYEKFGLKPIETVWSN